MRTPATVPAEGRKAAAEPKATVRRALAVLMVLVAVELHQDSVLNALAMQENEEKERGRHR